MGTFHDHSKMGEHHGMSVVIDTQGPKVFAGQCHEERADEIILTNADVLDTSTEGSKTKDEYINGVAKFGIHSRHARLVVPRSEIVSFQLLKDIRPSSN